MSVKLFQSLLHKSAKIQQKIDAEQRSRWPDRVKLLKLKKLRLRLKDRMLSIIRQSLEASRLTARSRMAQLQPMR